MGFIQAVQGVIGRFPWFTAPTGQSDETSLESFVVGRVGDGRKHSIIFSCATMDRLQRRIAHGP